MEVITVKITIVTEWFRGYRMMYTNYTAQKMKFSIKDFFSICDGHIY